MSSILEPEISTDADVFISYASENRAKAAAVAQALEADGLSVWWDIELRGGAQYESVIGRALDSSACVVVLWSQAAANSDWVTAESQRAFSAKKVVPVRLDDRSLPLSLSMFQAPSLAAWDGTAGSSAFAELREAIVKHLGRSRLVADAPCPLFRCVALRDWGCAAGGQDGIVRLWSLSDGRVVRELEGHGDLVTAIAWNGADLLASGSTDKSARLWSLDDGRPLHVLTGHNGPVDDIAFAGDTVLTVSSDRTARWWSIESGEPVQSQAFDQVLLSCAADRSGSLVAVGGTNGEVTLLADRQVVRVMADAHQGSVYAVELSPDGDRLLTAGADGLARLWDPTTGAMLRTFRGHRGPVLSCALGDDVVVTGSADATVRFWDPETGHQRDRVAGLAGGAPGVDLTTSGMVIATSGGGQVRAAGVPVPIVAKSTQGNGERWRN